MRLTTVADLKSALNQQADAMPMRIATIEGNVYTDAGLFILGGVLTLTLERSLEPTAEETVATLNAELVHA